MTTEIGSDRGAPPPKVKEPESIEAPEKDPGRPSAPLEDPSTDEPALEAPTNPETEREKEIQLLSRMS